MKPYSALFLSIAGFLLSGTGLYFIFIRPALLPEDLVYMASSLKTVQENVPDLMNWLQKVFIVMGGYIFTTGLLTIYISQTSFRNRVNGSLGIMALAGLSSIGLMSGVNFLIDSDFKWVLILFTIPWVISFALYLIKR